MQIAYSLNEVAKSSEPVVLTIGNFDGVHLGHQAVLKHLKQTAKKRRTRSAVLTFSNHPSTVLRPAHSIPLLCTTQHKVKLLEKAFIDLVILLPFTKEFSEQSADLFLQNVKKNLPFQTLILGSDAHFGKNREGDSSTVSTLAKTMGFTVEYFPDYTKEGQRISSSLIREYIQRGQLTQAEDLLGRPYSIYGPVLKGHGKGASIGFPTANLAVNDLCLPPLGVYAVTLKVDELEYIGVANLGLAPTVRHENSPILEVHLFDKHLDLYDKIVDVHFHNFIRSEKQFATIEELKKQIAQDVIKAKHIHSVRTQF